MTTSHTINTTVVRGGAPLATWLQSGQVCGWYAVGVVLVWGWCRAGVGLVWGWCGGGGPAAEINAYEPFPAAAPRSTLCHCTPLKPLGEGGVPLQVVAVASEPVGSKN